VCGSGPTALWQEAEGDPGQLLAEAARTADLVLAAKGDAGGLGESQVVEQLAMAAGVPVLMLPPGASGPFGTPSLPAGTARARRPAPCTRRCRS
jgi:hypothetical protein